MTRKRPIVVAAILSAVVVLVPTIASATTCLMGGHNWYGRANATLGAGTAQGSAITESMPTTYFAGANATADEVT